MPLHIVCENFRHGMNDREPSRSFGKYVVDGRYNGPFPLVKNLDRRDGVLKPAGHSERVGTARLGTVVGMFTKQGFVNDPVNAATAVSVYVTKQTSNGYIYVSKVMNASPYKRLRMLSLGNCGSYQYWETRPEMLDDRVLLYNERTAAIMGAWNDLGTAAYTMRWNGDDSTIRFASKRFGGLRSNWVGGNVHYKIGGVWYDNEISGISASMTGAATSMIYCNNGTDNPAGASGAITNICIVPKLDAYLEPPAVSWLSSGAYARATATGGTALSGSYYYAPAFVTSDGKTSNIGEWCAVVAPSAQSVLVENLPLASGETPGTDYVKVRLFRKGGTLGTTPYEVVDIDIPHANRAASPRRITEAGTTMSVSRTRVRVPTGQIAGWPAPGQVAVWHGSATPCPVHLAADSYLSYVSTTATGFNLATGDAVEGTIVHGSPIVLTSYIDNNADSVITGNAAGTDHGTGPSGYTSASRMGSRLAAVRSVTSRSAVGSGKSSAWSYATQGTNEICFSSTDDPQYFRSDSDRVIWDLDDQFTGGTVKVGSESEPIVKLVEFQGALIAFKKSKAYRLMGRGLPFIRIEELPNIPGCTAPDTVKICDQNLVWMHNKQLWLWDGESVLMDLTWAITELEGSTVQNLDKCHGYYWNEKYYLHYDVSSDSFRFSRYIEWDFKLTTPYADTNWKMPSASIGDTCPVSHAAWNPSADYMYGAGGTSGQEALYKLHGKGTNPYNNDTRFVTRLCQVQLPDLPVGDGMSNAVAEEFYCQMYADGALPTATVSVYPRVNCASQSALDKSYGRVTSAQVQFKHFRMSATNRGHNLGALVQGLSQNWTNTAACRVIDRMSLGIGQVSANQRDLQ